MWDFYKVLRIKTKILVMQPLNVERPTQTNSSLALKLLTASVIMQNILGFLLVSNTFLKVSYHKLFMYQTPSDLHVCCFYSGVFSSLKVWVVRQPFAELSQGQPLVLPSLHSRAWRLSVLRQWRRKWKMPSISQAQQASSRSRNND